jgi:hypothetical protein
MSARRVLRIMAILMLLVTPLRLAAGGAAMASLHSFDVTMNLGHCDGDRKSDKGQARPHAHCSMAVPAIPSGSETVAVLPGAAMRAQPLALDAYLNGLGPEARTPPPRTS